MSKKKYTAEDIVRKIRYRYENDSNGRQAAVVLEQVPNATGYHCRSWIDVMVFQLWPSRGLIRSAIEVKVDRQDFLRELRDPTKNQWARNCCHEFWYAGPACVIKEDELPEGAGWLAPRGDTMTTKRAASRKDDVPVTDLLLAAIMRAVDKEIKNRANVEEDRVLESSKIHQEYKTVYEGALRFIKQRGQFGFRSLNADDVVQQLNECTTDKAHQAQAHRARSALEHFRNNISALLDIMIPIAYLGLFEADRAGKALFTGWGAVDKGAMKEALKRVRARYNVQGERKREIVQLLHDLLPVPKPK